MKLIITGLDVETTGFHAEKGDRITEVAMLVYSYDTETREFKNVGKLSTLINPMRPISLEVQKITNITPALIKDCPTWDEIAPKVSKVMAATDIMIAHNADFDSTFIAHELMRLSLPLNYEMEVFCTMQSGRFATPTGKFPKLIELCWALGVEFKPEDAHRAIYDTEKMMQAVFAGIDKQYFDLSMAINGAIETKTKKAA